MRVWCGLQFLASPVFRCLRLPPSPFLLRCQVAAKKKGGEEAVEEIAAVQAIKAAIEEVETRQAEVPVLSTPHLNLAEYMTSLLSDTRSHV